MISNKEGWPKRMKLSDTVKIAIIAGIVTLGQAYIATRVIKVDNKVEEVHKQINSRMDELIETTEKASKAEGKAEEKAETDAKPQDEK